jgi:serine/threonine protein kinase
MTLLSRHVLKTFSSHIYHLVAGGTLASHCSTSNLTEKETAEYTLQILNGLGYLHSQKPIIIHGDLKGDNVVLTLDKKVAKICDLDSSVVCVKSTLSRKSRRPGKIGTLCFMSPEMLAHNDTTDSTVGRKTDIWSVGCIVLQMLGRGEFYFREQDDGPLLSVRRREDELRIVVVNGGRPDIPKTASSELQLFLQECLQRNPNLRPKAWDLTESEFLKPRSESPLEILEPFANQYVLTSS